MPQGGLLGPAGAPGRVGRAGHDHEAGRAGHDREAGPATPAEGGTRRARPRAGWRVIRRGLGVLLATGTAAAAVFYLEPFDRLGEVIRAALSVETATAPPPAPVRPVVPKPSPRVGVEEPLVAAPSPGSSPSGASRREPAAAVPTPAAPPEPARSAGVPPEPARSAGVPVDRCVTPTPAAVALSGQIDSTAETPRCLYVVEREGGVQWVVDSARVQLRPQ
jgi:hypothetical protein